MCVLEELEARIEIKRLDAHRMIVEEPSHFRDASTQAAIHEGAWTYAHNDESDPEDETDHRFKAVAPGAELLFDRRVDPGENVNLARHEPRETERLRGVLREHMAGGMANVRERGVRIDPGIAKRLRAMGYLQ